MNKRIIYIFTLSGVSAFVVLLTVLSVVTIKNSKGNPSVTKKVNSVVLTQSYEKEVPSALSAFTAAYANTDSVSRKIAIEAVKTKLLTLRVPATYKDLHLGLILALTHLEGGYTVNPANTEEIKTGTLMFNEAVRPIAWLSSLQLP
ncbi:MAG: hypothetical protein WC817_04345 [Patescibacteria group bacterium]|jgi:hypothetical protein